MISTDSNIHWVIGDVPVEDALQEKSNSGEAAAFLHLDTPSPPSAEQRAAPAYGYMLRKGWDVAVAALPTPVIGKRAGMEQFWFLIDGDRPAAEAQSRALMAALQGDGDAGQLVWRIVLSPVTTPWNNAVILAEWLALDQPSPVPTEHNSIFWINGDWRHAGDAEVDVVVEYSPKMIGGGQGSMPRSTSTNIESMVP